MKTYRKNIIMVMGRKPKNRPYVRIGKPDGEFLDSIEGMNLVNLIKIAGKAMGYRVEKKP